MTPLPKKKHTRSRSNKRKNAAAHRMAVPNLVKCANCGELKYPHRACSFCGQYGNSVISPQK